jgi:NSS family neurotransmitter:Na+ symporter
LISHRRQGGATSPRRPLFSSKLAFVLAASASAIGLGNLWRFPALAARYGGGAFLLTYIALVLTFGFALMTAEIAIGRRTGRSVIEAITTLDRRFRFVGYLEALVPAIILPYYCVIGGWIMRYGFGYVEGLQTPMADGGGFFAAFVSEPLQVLLWTALFALLAMAVVRLGLRNGVEKLNMIFMPLLLILGVSVGIYALTLPGALEGLVFFLVPRVEDFGLFTLVAAMGQMFFSLSLAMGIMITYGSYLSKEDDVGRGVNRIEFFDTVVALLAGFIVIPAVFAFGGAEAAKQAGPNLMFVVLPQVFSSAPLAQVLGLAFFALVFFAALTSAVSLGETLVSIVVDHFGLRASRAVAAVTGGVLALAALPALGFSVLAKAQLPLGAQNMGILDFMDFVSNSLLMPLVALFVCLLVGWRLPREVLVDELTNGGTIRMRRAGLFWLMVRWVAPAFLLIILVSSVLNALGVITI